MYQLISAIAKNIEDDTRWHNVDIGSMPMRDIYATYSAVIATLKDTFATNNVSLDLGLLRAKAGGLTTTLNDYLTANGNITLPTSTDLPVINTRYAKYADAFHAGYKIEAVAPGVAPDAQLPPSEKTWLHLTKKISPPDYHLMYKSVLPVVNGFIHASDADDNGFYVQNGMKSQMISGSNMLGLVSFREIGELAFVPITPDMIYRQNDRQLLKNQCFIDTQQDVSQKTVMLVLGGYLHVLDESTFFRVSDSSFCINFNNIPLLDRYYESRGYIDLSSMNVDISTNNPDQVGMASLYSDQAITAYCTLSQSFFIVLDKHDIFVDRITVGGVPGPGKYQTSIVPLWPMVAGHGKLANYWYTLDDGFYALSTFDTSIDNRMYDTTQTLGLNSVSDSNDSHVSTRKSEAYFLRIGCDI